ncbi:8064_t:CDS:2, partial [Paraglomus brasilianum]
KLVVNQGFSLVDKTLLVKKPLDSDILVSLVVRLRCFGKTTNLAMLKNFFAVPIAPKKHQLELFKYSNIWHEKQLFKEHFASTDFHDWNHMKQKIVLVLADLYQVQEHNYLYEKLNFFERKQFDLICGKSATDLSCALKTLSGYLKNIISDDKLGDGMAVSARHFSSNSNDNEFREEIVRRYLNAMDPSIRPPEGYNKDNVSPYIDKIGTHKQIFYTPYKPLYSPESLYDITISKLLSAGLHLGHSTSLWNPVTFPFIFGTRAGISIINLEYTIVYLRRACRVVREVALRGGIILFVGTRAGFAQATIEAARRCNGYQVTKRWLPGTISNSRQILGKLTPAHPDGGGGPPEVFKPDLAIVLNPLENAIVLAEMKQANIPTIGITDTDFDPRKVTYPIPANDDSVRGVTLIAGVLSVAARDGLNHRRKLLKEQEERQAGKFGIIKVRVQAMEESKREEENMIDNFDETEETEEAK